MINFDRGKFDSSIGFLLDMNGEFTFINDFDFESNSATGFSVFKNKSVKDYEVFDDPNSFDALLLKIKKVKPKSKLSISIDSMTDLIKTASETFPLIVVHREKIDSETCWIGKIVEIKKKSFLMRAIDTNAEWEEHFTKVAFKDVTKIDFGNGYENALILVADYREKRKP